MQKKIINAFYSINYLYICAIIIKQNKMETLTQWQVWVSKDSQPIIISVPFKNVNDAQEFIWEQIGKSPASMSKL